MIRSSHEFIKPANSSLNKFVNSQRKENTNRNGQGWHQKGHKNLFWRIVESLRLGKNLTRAADRGTVAPLVLLRFLTQAGCLRPPLSREEVDREQRDLKKSGGLTQWSWAVFHVCVSMACQTAVTLECIWHQQNWQSVFSNRLSGCRW